MEFSIEGGDVHPFLSHSYSESSETTTSTTASHHQPINTGNCFMNHPYEACPNRLMIAGESRNTRTQINQGFLDDDDDDDDEDDNDDNDDNDDDDDDDENDNNNNEDTNGDRRQFFHLSRHWSEAEDMYDQDENDNNSTDTESRLSYTFLDDEEQQQQQYNDDDASSIATSTTNTEPNRSDTTNPDESNTTGGSNNNKLRQQEQQQQKGRHSFRNLFADSDDDEENNSFQQDQNFEQPQQIKEPLLNESNDQKDLNETNTVSRNDSQQVRQQVPDPNYFDDSEDSDTDDIQELDKKEQHEEQVINELDDSNDRNDLVEMNMTDPQHEHQQQDRRQRNFLDDDNDDDDDVSHSKSDIDIFQDQSSEQQPEDPLVTEFNAQNAAPELDETNTVGIKNQQEGEQHGNVFGDSDNDNDENNAFRYQSRKQQSREELLGCEGNTQNNATDPDETNTVSRKNPPQEQQFEQRNVVDGDLEQSREEQQRDEITINEFNYPNDRTDPNRPNADSMDPQQEGQNHQERNSFHDENDDDDSQNEYSNDDDDNETIHEHISVDGQQKLDDQHANELNDQNDETDPDAHSNDPRDHDDQQQQDFFDDTDNDYDEDYDDDDDDNDYNTFRIQIREDQQQNDESPHNGVIDQNEEPNVAFNDLHRDSDVNQDDIHSNDSDVEVMLPNEQVLDVETSNVELAAGPSRSLLKSRQQDDDDNDNVDQNMNAHGGKDNANDIGSRHDTNDTDVKQQSKGKEQNETEQQEQQKYQPSSNATRKQLSEEVMCPLCLDILVHSTTLVPCGHSVCLSCLPSLHIEKNINRNSVRRRHAGNGSKVCPICREKVLTTVVCRSMDNMISGLVRLQQQEEVEQNPPEHKEAINGASSCGKKRKAVSITDDSNGIDRDQLCKRSVRFFSQDDVSVYNERISQPRESQQITIDIDSSDSIDNNDEVAIVPAPTVMLTPTTSIETATSQRSSAQFVVSRSTTTTTTTTNHSNFFPELSNVNYNSTNNYNPVNVQAFSPPNRSWNGQFSGAPATTRNVTTAAPTLLTTLPVNGGGGYFGATDTHSSSRNGTNTYSNNRSDSYNNSYFTATSGNAASPYGFHGSGQSTVQSQQYHSEPLAPYPSAAASTASAIPLAAAEMSQTHLGSNINNNSNTVSNILSWNWFRTSSPVSSRANGTSDNNPVHQHNHNNSQPQSQLQHGAPQWNHQQPQGPLYNPNSQYAPSTATSSTTRSTTNPRDYNFGNNANVATATSNPFPQLQPTSSYEQPDSPASAYSDSQAVLRWNSPNTTANAPMNYATGNDANAPINYATGNDAQIGSTTRNSTSAAQEAIARSTLGDSFVTTTMFAHSQSQQRHHSTRSTNTIPDASTLVSTFNEYSNQGNSIITNNLSDVTYNSSYNNSNIVSDQNATRAMPDPYRSVSSMLASPTDTMDRLFTNNNNTNQNNYDATDENESNIINYRAVFDDDNSSTTSGDIMVNTIRSNSQSSSGGSRSNCATMGSNSTNIPIHNAASGIMTPRTSTNIYDLTSVPDGTSLDDAICIE